MVTCLWLHLSFSRSLSLSLRLWLRLVFRGIVLLPSVGLRRLDKGALVLVLALALLSP